MKDKIFNYWSLIVNYLLVAFWFLYVLSCFHLLIKHVVSNTILCYLISFVFASIVLFFSFKFRNRKCFSVQIHSSRYSFKTILLKCSDSVLYRFILIFILPLALRIILIFIFPIPIQGDPGVYIDIAKEISVNGIVSRNAEYSSNFPHLFWFGMFLIPASMFSCFGDWVFQVYISCIISCNALLIYVIGKNLCKNKLSAFKIAIIYSYLPSQLFCGLTVTHEIIFTFFLLSALAVWCTRKSMLSWIAVCFLLSIAKLVNSVGIITLLALLSAVFFVWNSFKKIRLRLLALFLLILISVGVTFCANSIQTKMTKGNFVLCQSSVEWQLYIGGNTSSEGGWNKQDLNVFSQLEENVENTDDLKKAYRDLVVERWGNNVKSPLNLSKLFLVKFCKDWSGTHYPFGIISYYFSTGTASRILTMLMFFNHLLYMTLIIFAFPGLFKRKNSVDSDVTIFLKTSILGTVCMLFFTETMNKYTLTMLGPIILLIGYYLHYFNENRIVESINGSNIEKSAKTEC